MYANHGHQNPARRRAAQTANELRDARNTDPTEPPAHIRAAWQRHASEPLFELHYQDPGCAWVRYESDSRVAAVGGELRHAAEDSFPGVVYNVRLAR